MYFFLFNFLFISLEVAKIVEGMRPPASVSGDILQSTLSKTGYRYWQITIN